jgi:hypothetical protein
VRRVDEHDAGHLAGVPQREEPHDERAGGVADQHVRRGQPERAEELAQLPHLPLPGTG